MSEKVIGMLGGMGPEATLDCFGKILRNTRAGKDQDHLRVLIDNHPQIPDRTAAILGQGESPVPVMVRSIQGLARSGADFVIIPCVSAHFFLEDLRRQVDIPILSIFDVVAEAIVQARPVIRTVGLMGTTGTVRGQAFQRRLQESGLDTLVPDEQGQARVMAGIYDIKNAAALRPRAEVTADLAAEAAALVRRGAQGIIAGCTEIPLALSQAQVSVPYFDSLTVLARAAIRMAGKEPTDPAP